jgi:hypothetical protein
MQAGARSARRMPEHGRRGLDGITLGIMPMISHGRRFVPDLMQHPFYNQRIVDFLFPIPLNLGSHVFDGSSRSHSCIEEVVGIAN